MHAPPKAKNLLGEPCQSALLDPALSPVSQADHQDIEPTLQDAKSDKPLQNWEDEDMKGLLDVLAEQLAENIQLLSSFDKYKREVLGGNLDWGPMHTNEQFWRDNTAKLEEKDFQIIRVLLKLLETSRDVRI